MIVGKCAITVQFLEVGKYQLQVIQRKRPLRMPGHLRNLPGRELGVDVLGQALTFLLQTGYFFGNIHRRITLRQAQRLDIAFEVGNCMLKVQKTGFHRIHTVTETADILTYRQMIASIAKVHQAMISHHRPSNLVLIS